ncbi:hypothetical protein [Methylosinus sp. Sm6]|uniref:hypothetical protein n=1 Tax=Methylosinus sp. Sm6 TaxID=2866948 RepID=UPI001C9A2878|nr:hypothetical protein [Methylosinus sp. Sm6]MBY6243919.1 hypothetical protein [Methylosinus sp. Sm6]
MKTALSALLDEMFDAEKLVYDDCARWQMQCPACHEAVFKVLRQEAGRDLHYFAHYRRDKLLAEECELRVGAMNAEEVAKHNAAARGQRLAYYLSVLKDQFTPIYGERLPTLRKMIGRTWAGRKIRTDSLIVAAKADLKGNFLDCATHIVDLPETKFELARQQEIALHIWMHLLSNTGRDNFDFMIDLVLIDFHQENVGYGDARLLDVVRPLIMGGKREAQEVHWRLSHEEWQGFNGWAAIVNFIVFVSFNKLLGLNYWQLTKEFYDAQNKGRA